MVATDLFYLSALPFDNRKLISQRLKRRLSMIDRTRIEHGNRFHQSISNAGKLGFYPTDPAHCKKIATMFKWPQKEVNVLEPSIGDGVALKCVLSDADKSFLHTFGVELNTDIFNALNERKEEMGVDYLLHADFLRGVKISNNKFNFCFANPPYGEEADGVRLEQLFVEKIFGYMKSRGLFCLVIPYYILKNDKFVRSFFGRFEPIATYKFEDAEFSKYKQIVVFAKRRPCMGYLRDTMISWLESLSDLEKIEYLMQADASFDVPGGAEKIEYFTTKEFDSDSFRKALLKSTLIMSGNHGCVRPYTATKAGNPPLPLTNETSHLVAVCGVGSGFAGNEDEGTLHLQRGTVEIAEVEEVITEKNKEPYISVTRSSVTAMNIIDSQFNYIKIAGTAKAAADDDND